jgi:hypothetical protein
MNVFKWINCINVKQWLNFTSTQNSPACTKCCMRRGKDRILQSQMCCLRVRLHFIKLIMDSMTCVQLHESNPKASCFTPIQTSDYVNGQKANKTPHSTLSSSTMQLIWSGSCFFAGLGRSWSSCPLVLVIGLTRAKELRNYKTKHWLRYTSGKCVKTCAPLF